MARNPTQEEIEEIGKALIAGRKIEAIKLYREITGDGLAASKGFIEKLEGELRSVQPERFASQPSQRQDPGALLFWLLWIGSIGSVIAIAAFTSKPPHAGRNPFPSSLWIAGAIPVALGILIRWLLLPRFEKYRGALPFFIIGLALSEFSCIAGLLLFADHRDALFALGFLGILLYAPVFAGRLTR